MRNPKVMPDFSEQAYLDCFKRNCYGYLPFKVWDYIHTHNVTDEKNNPYKIDPQSDYVNVRVFVIDQHTLKLIKLLCRYRSANIIHRLAALKPTVINVTGTRKAKWWIMKINSEPCW